MRVAVSLIFVVGLAAVGYAVGGLRAGIVAGFAYVVGEGVSAALGRFGAKKP